MLNHFYHSIGQNTLDYYFSARSDMEKYAGISATESIGEQYIECNDLTSSAPFKEDLLPQLLCCDKA